jgi:hypothetical protein
MELTSEQQKALEIWSNDGLSLSDIQAHLNEKFSLSLTYMEVRFFVDDLNLTLQDKPELNTAVLNDNLESVNQGAPVDSDNAVEDMGGSGDDFGSSLTIEVDRLMKPGSVVSGTVKFSDGVNSSWSIDQFGRLGLNPSQEGYQPSAEDLQAFQKELQSALQKHGM